MCKKSKMNANLCGNKVEKKKTAMTEIHFAFHVYLICCPFASDTGLLYTFNCSLHMGNSVQYFLHFRPLFSKSFNLFAIFPQCLLSFYLEGNLKSITSLGYQTRVADVHDRIVHMSSFIYVSLKKRT